MIKYLYRIIIAVLCIAVLTGCEQSKPCIDADDFGFPKIALNAQGIDVEQSGADSKGIPIQVSKWKDSELVIGSQTNTLAASAHERSAPWVGVKIKSPGREEIACIRVPHVEGISFRRETT